MSKEFKKAEERSQREDEKKQLEKNKALAKLDSKKITESRKKEVKYFIFKSKAHYSTLEIHKPNTNIINIFDHNLTLDEHYLYNIPKTVQGFNYNKVIDRKAFSEYRSENYPYIEYLTPDIRSLLQHNVMVFPQQIIVKRLLLGDKQKVIDALVHIVQNDADRVSEVIYYSIHSEYVILPRIDHYHKELFGNLPIIYTNNYYYPIRLISASNPIKEFAFSKDKILNVRQLITLNIILEYFSENVANRHVLINLGTAVGKTFLSLSVRALIESKNKRVLIIINRLNLIDQWKEAILDMYPGSTVTEISSTISTMKNFNKNADFMISTPSFLLKPDSILFEDLNYSNAERDSMYGDFFSQFSLVISDEVHNLVSSTKFPIFQKISKSYNIFLSATINENVKKESYLRFIGKIITEDELKRKGMKYNIKYIPVQFNYAKLYRKYNYNEATVFGVIDNTTKMKNDKISFTSLCNKMCADPFKIVWICYLIAGYAIEGNVILFLADRVEYLTLIKFFYKRLINKKDFIFPFEINDYYDKVKTIALDYDYFLDSLKDKKNLTAINRVDFDLDGFNVTVNSSNDIYSSSYELLSKNSMYNDPVIITGSDKNDHDSSNIILSTFSSMGEGKDIPRLNIVIFGGSRKSYLDQFAGRVVRRTEGKDRVVCDIVNNSNKITIKHGIKKEEQLGVMFNNIKSFNVKPKLSTVFTDANTTNVKYNLIDDIESDNKKPANIITSSHTYRFVSKEEANDNKEYLNAYTMFYRKPYESI